jgi:hypothetical protein
LATVLFLGGDFQQGEPSLKQGVDKAWEALAACDPQEVSERAQAERAKDGQGYILRVFGHPISVDIGTRTLGGDGPESEFVLTKTAYFSRLSILHYLLGAQKIEPTGRLVNPVDLKTGQIYLKGSHLLPLEGIAARFSADSAAFLDQAARFGGERRDYGDVSVELRPFPRVPVTLILWQEDEEFPARSYLLFDETCEQHLPPDIVWSVAMMSALAMLKG